MTDTALECVHVFILNLSLSIILQIIPTPIHDVNYRAVVVQILSLSLSLPKPTNVGRRVCNDVPGACIICIEWASAGTSVSCASGVSPACIV